MKDELYDKVSNYMSMADVLDQYIADLGTTLSDARNQAENGSEMGMAVAVGAASGAFEHLVSAWRVIKNEGNKVRPVKKK